MSGRRLPLRKRIERWSESIDPTYRSHRTWLQLQAGGTVLLLGLIALGAFVPGTRELFGLEPAVPLCLLLVARSYAFAVAVLDRRIRLGPTMLFAAALGFSFLECLLAASFIVYADGPAAYALAAIAILRAGFDGIAFGAGLELPLLTAAHALGLLAPLALRPGAANAWLLALVAPLAVLVFLLLAGGRMRFARERELQREQQRTLLARALADRAVELQAVNESLVAALERSHDARSVLTAAQLRAARVSEEARGEPAVATEARALQGALARIEDAIERGRRAVRSESLAAAGPLAAIPIGPALEEVLTESRLRYPGVRLAAAGDTAAAGLVRGGAPGLGQLLRLLVAHACEGDGRGRSDRVDVRVRADRRTGALAVEVEGDGPDSAPPELHGSIAPLAGPGGDGLTLYTAERLVRASGGSLRWEALPAGGARVTVYLELAPAPGGSA